MIAPTLYLPQNILALVIPKASAPALMLIARGAALFRAQCFRLGQLGRRDVKRFHGKNLAPFLGGVKQEGRVG